MDRDFFRQAVGWCVVLRGQCSCVPEAVTSAAGRPVLYLVGGAVQSVWCTVYGRPLPWTTARKRSRFFYECMWLPCVVGEAAALRGVAQCGSDA